jgi:hypothetical protein
MKKVKTRAEWLNEAEEAEFNSLDENEMVDIDISVEADTKDVMKKLEDIENVTDKKAMDFGVIKAKAMKKRLAAIRQLPGVEKVEVAKKDK